MMIRTLLFAILIAVVSSATCSVSWAQKKRLDLEDISIKGELFGDDRLHLLNREENELKNYVKFRTNYRNEITEELPEPRPGVVNRNNQ